MNSRAIFPTPLSPALRVGAESLPLLPDSLLTLAQEDTIYWAPG